MFLYRHELRQTAQVRWSPDGQYIAALCHKTIHIFDAQAGKSVLIRELDISENAHFGWLEGRTEQNPGRVFNSNEITLILAKGYQDGVWIMRDSIGEILYFSTEDYVFYWGTFLPDERKLHIGMNIF
jgi:hypothetical protein